MKSLQQYIKESHKVPVFNCMVRIKKSPYSFLIANNIWTNANDGYDKAIEGVMKRLGRECKIFDKFDTPTLQPQNPRGGSRQAIGKLEGYQLIITFNYCDEYNSEQPNDKYGEPIFVKNTSRWSQTDEEKKRRSEYIEKSGFNDFVEEYGYKYKVK